MYSWSLCGFDWYIPLSIRSVMLIIAEKGLFRSCEIIVKTLSLAAFFCSSSFFCFSRLRFSTTSFSCSFCISLAFCVIASSRLLKLRRRPSSEIIIFSHRSGRCATTWLNLSRVRIRNVEPCRVVTLVERGDSSMSAYSPKY